MPLPAILVCQAFRSGSILRDGLYHGQFDVDVIKWIWSFDHASYPFKPKL